MKITPELFNLIENCTTPEELVSLAKDREIELSVKEAEEILSSLNSELTDEELSTVAGGSWICPEDTSMCDPGIYSEPK